MSKIVSAFVPCITFECSYLREGTVVPQVTLVGEAVADESKLALLDVLLNRVEELLDKLKSCYKQSCCSSPYLFLGDLNENNVSSAMRGRTEQVNNCNRKQHTSNLPLVHLGISTTMFRIVCCSLAYRGIS
jgi:hypothetical protein